MPHKSLVSYVSSSVTLRHCFELEKFHWGACLCRFSTWGQQISNHDVHYIFFFMHPAEMERLCNPTFFIVELSFGLKHILKKTSNFFTTSLRKRMEIIDHNHWQEVKTAKLWAVNPNNWEMMKCNAEPTGTAVWLITTACPHISHLLLTLLH